MRYRSRPTSSRVVAAHFEAATPFEVSVAFVIAMALSWLAFAI